MLRWIVLGYLAFLLVGCGTGKKEQENASKPGSGGSSGQLSPTYHWKRPPADSQRLTKPENSDLF